MAGLGWFPSLKTRVSPNFVESWFPPKKIFLPFKKTNFRLCHSRNSGLPGQNIPLIEQKNPEKKRAGELSLFRALLYVSGHLKSLQRP